MIFQPLFLHYVCVCVSMSVQRQGTCTEISFDNLMIHSKTQRQHNRDMQLQYIRMQELCMEKTRICQWDYASQSICINKIMGLLHVLGCRTNFYFYCPLLIGNTLPTNTKYFLQHTSLKAYICKTLMHSIFIYIQMQCLYLIYTQLHSFILNYI